MVGRVCRKKVFPSWHQLFCFCCINLSISGWSVFMLRAAPSATYVHYRTQTWFTKGVSAKKLPDCFPYILWNKAILALPCRPILVYQIQVTKASWDSRVKCLWTSVPQVSQRKTPSLAGVLEAFLRGLYSIKMYWKDSSHGPYESLKPVSLFVGLHPRTAALLKHLCWWRRPKQVHCYLWEFP